MPASVLANSARPQRLSPRPSQGTGLSAQKISILLVEARPAEARLAKIDEDAAALSDAIAMWHGQTIEVVTCPAATRLRFWQKLIAWGEPRPGVHRIVHFAGHGDVSGFHFRGDGGERVSVDPKALCDLLAERNITTAVFNNCYSAEAYRDLSIPWGIVMEGELSGGSAVAFATGFYIALAAGNAIPVAFKEGELYARFSKHPVKARLVGTRTLSSAATDEPRPSREPREAAARDDVTGVAVAVLASRNGDHQALTTALGGGFRLPEATLLQILRERPAVLSRTGEEQAAARLWDRIHFEVIATYRRDADASTIGLRRGAGGLWLCRIDDAPGRTWFTVHPVTRGEYAELGGDVPGALRDVRDRWHPQTGLSWYDARAFIEKLNARFAERGRYRLPTTAEWRLAASDLASRLSASNEGLHHLGWLGATRTCPVGMHHPNRHGLLDLVGNVAEWTGSDEDREKQACGGSFRSHPKMYALSASETIAPDQQLDWIGIRLLWEDDG